MELRVYWARIVRCKITTHRQVRANRTTIDLQSHRSDPPSPETSTAELGNVHAPECRNFEPSVKSTKGQQVVAPKTSQVLGCRRRNTVELLERCLAEHKYGGGSI